MPAIQSDYSGMRANFSPPVVQIFVNKGKFVADFSKNHHFRLGEKAGLSSLEEAIERSLVTVEEEIHHLVDERVIEDPGEVAVKFEFVANKPPVQN